MFIYLWKKQIVGNEASLYYHIHELFFDMHVHSSLWKMHIVVNKASIYHIHELFSISMFKT